MRVTISNAAGFNSLHKFLASFYVIAQDHSEKMNENMDAVSRYFFLKYNPVIDKTLVELLGKLT